MTAPRTQLRPDKALAILLIAIILAAEAFAIPIRYLVNDDYQMLYTAWLRSTGQVPLKDFGIQSYHILPDLLAPFLRWTGDSLGAVLRLRWIFWAGLAALPALAASLAKRLGAPTWPSLVAISSLATWAVLERGLDIRPDLLMGLLWLWLLIRAMDAKPGMGANLFSGALLASALILRIKAVLIAPGLMLLLADPRRFRVSYKSGFQDLSKRIGMQLAGAALVGLAFLAYLGATGQIPYFLQGNLVLAGIAKSGLNRWEIHKVSFGNLCAHDWPFALLAVVGIVRYALRGRSDLQHGWRGGLAILLTSALFVTADPAFYSYNFLILLPLLSVFVGFGGQWILDSIKGPDARKWCGMGLLLALPLWHAPMIWRLAELPSNQHQLALSKAVTESRKGTVIFAMEGLGLFRPSIYDWRMSAVSTPLYFAGKIDLSRELRESKPEIILMSYRIPGWLVPADREWMGGHYVLASGDVCLFGAKVTSGAPDAILDVPRSQPYSVIGDPCRVDGTVREPNQVFQLEVGIHHLSDSTGSSVICYAWPGLKGLAGAPQGPFLISPDTAIYEGGSGL